MKIKTTITFQQYRNLIFFLTYRKVMMKVILCVALGMLGWIISYYTSLLHVPKPQFYQYTTLVLITIVQPVVIYSTIWKNYHSSCQLKEPLEIEITETELILKGHSFYTEIPLKKIYQVEELKSWFLYYQNSLSAVIIPKSAMTHKQQKDLIKELQASPHSPVHLLPENKGRNN